MLLFAFSFAALGLAAAGLAAGVIGGREPPAGTCRAACLATGRRVRCEACPAQPSPAHGEATARTEGGA